jgi:tetratricopeptide (TPR) repeat protein
VLVALLASGTYYRYFRKTVIVATDAGTASSLPTTTTTSSTSAPPPSENPEALAAYQEGLQQWRDGSSRRSRASMERAVKADAGFAAANLELAVQMLLAHERLSSAQEYYQKAYSHRDRLSPPDRALLAAVDPLTRASQELGAAETTLVNAAAQFKKDPVFDLMLGYVRESRADYEQARTDYERAIARDPTFIPALLGKGHVLLQLGNADAALEAYGKCIRASSAAAMCLEQRMLLLRDRGECDAMEQDARAWQTVEPEASEPSYYVAAALMARGEPLQSVEIALRRQWDAMPKDERSAGEAEDTANLALARGEFQAAERATTEWDVSSTKQEVLLHSGPQQQLAFIAYETGDVQKAARIADSFLKILPALTPGPNNADPTMWTEEYLFRTGRVTKADLDEKRKTWLRDRESGRTQQENLRLAPFRWAQIYAAFAENIEEAREALDKLPDFLPLPPASRHTAIFDAELGKTYALAGKHDEALAPLRAVTGACIALGSPIPQTRSFYFLGMALEGKGDLEGARKAYQTVIDRWGGAHVTGEGKALKSRTAEEAKKRLKLLE